MTATTRPRASVSLVREREAASVTVTSGPEYEVRTTAPSGVVTLTGRSRASYRVTVQSWEIPSASS